MQVFLIFGSYSNIQQNQAVLDKVFFSATQKQQASRQNNHVEVDLFNTHAM